MKPKCNPRITTACDVQVLKEAEKPACEPFSFCLPFGGHVTWNGECISYKPGTPPPDGTYSRIIIADGCIVGAEPYEAPIYNSEPCAPIPNPCDCQDGSGSLPDPSVQTGNLFTYDAAGRPLVKVTIHPGDGISVQGDGSTANPFIISAKLDSGIGIQHFKSGNDAITLTGDGSQESPYTITHKLGIEQTVQGMKFDEYGHLVEYNEPSTTGKVNGVVGSDGVDVTPELSTGIYTVKLSDPVESLAGEYRFGAFNVTVDKKNRLQKITRELTAPSGTYTFGDYNVTVNDYGDVTAVSAIPPVDTAGMVLVSATKYFPKSGTGDMTRAMSISTLSDSQLRIVYRSLKCPAELQLNIDGVLQTGHPFSNAATSTAATTTAFNGTWEFLTTSVLAAGSHDLQFVTTDEEGFADPALIDVWLTTVVV